jgi:hypothetical protein
MTESKEAQRHGEKTQGTIPRVKSSLLPCQFLLQYFSDPGVRDLARGNFNRDSALTRDDMLGLVARVEADGVVSGAEPGDQLVCAPAYW